MTIQGATFNMHGQLYRRHANATALFSNQVLVLAGARHCVLEMCRGKKKMQALLLGLAKSRY